jgi:hypothetical protein
VGGDLFIKYRQPEALSFVTLQVEALQRYYDTAGGGRLKDFGWYAELEYRLPGGWERWHVGAGYVYVGAKQAPVPQLAPGEVDPDGARRYRVSPVLTFYPSEFSKIRLQYDYDKPDDGLPVQHVGILQFEFTIGAHGAHKF